jgi:hypothetical protein
MRTDDASAICHVVIALDRDRACAKSLQLSEGNRHPFWGRFLQDPPVRHNRPDKPAPSGVPGVATQRGPG